MQPGLPCICAYLDACAPDLPAATQSLIAQGVKHLIVLPLFLGTGKHAREDIPRLLDELRRQHPGCRFDLQTAAARIRASRPAGAAGDRGGSRHRSAQTYRFQIKNSFFRYLKHNDASS
jgi:sirohydrochlorin ferrochelatase